MDETKQQIDQLQQLFRTDDVLAKVLDAFSKYTNAVREVTVDRIWTRIGQPDVKRSHVVAALKKLDELGFGKYTKGAHSYPSRFGFARRQGPVRLAMLARGEVEEDLPDDFISESGNSEPESQTVLSIDDSTSIVHKFRLRRGQEIIFCLPEDLTLREANRLSLWLKSIPFESDGDEF